MISRFTHEQRRRLWRWGGGGVLFLLLIWTSSFFFIVGININFSLPGYVYLVIRDREPVKNGLAAFHPPPNDLYPRTWFIKYVKGVPGDLVSWDGNQFSINGTRLGSARTHTENGLALARGAEGVIPDDEYFMWTDHPRSFDSRYARISLVQRDRLIGRAYRLF